MCGGFYQSLKILCTSYCASHDFFHSVLLIDPIAICLWKRCIVYSSFHELQHGLFLSGGNFHVFSFCQSFDQELKGLISDIAHYLGKPECKGHLAESYWKTQPSVKVNQWYVVLYYLMNLARVLSIPNL